jgi:hypothetical protein
VLCVGSATIKVPGLAVAEVHREVQPKDRCRKGSKGGPDQSRTQAEPWQWQLQSAGLCGENYCMLMLLTYEPASLDANQALLQCVLTTVVCVCTT